MRHLSGRAFAHLFLLAGVLVVAAPLAAQDYPTKPIRFIVPVGAGSGFDATARLLGDHMAKRMGQPFVVENQPGGGTTLGLATLARAPADGYTIGMLLSPATVQQSLMKLSFDTRKDLAPIALIGWDFNILVVNAEMAPKTVPELIAHLKANPEKVNYASGGNGTPAHLAAEFFQQQTGTKMVHVPYKTAVAAGQDLIAGRVQVMFGNVPATLPHIQSGKLRALAVVGKQRLAALPDTPSMVEVGYPAIDVPNWTAIVAPTGTPPAIIAKLQSEIATTMADPAVQAQITRFATVIDVAGPERLGALIAADVARWAEVIQKADIKADP